MHYNNIQDSTRQYRTKDLITLLRDNGVQEEEEEEEISNYETFQHSDVMSCTASHWGSWEKVTGNLSVEKVSVYLIRKVWKIRKQI